MEHALEEGQVSPGSRVGQRRVGDQDAEAEGAGLVEAEGAAARCDPREAVPHRQHFLFPAAVAVAGPAHPDHGLLPPSHPRRPSDGHTTVDAAMDAAASDADAVPPALKVVEQRPNDGVDPRGLGLPGSSAPSLRLLGKDAVRERHRRIGQPGPRILRGLRPLRRRCQAALGRVRPPAAAEAAAAAIIIIIIIGRALTPGPAPGQPPPGAGAPGHVPEERSDHGRNGVLPQYLAGRGGRQDVRQVGLGNIGGGGG